MAQTQENARTAGERLAARRAAKAARKAAKHTPAAPDGVPDEVTRGVLEASSWLDRNQKPFWGAFAVLAIVGIIAASSLMSVEKRNRDAGKLLSDALRTMLSPVGEPPPDDDGFLTYYGSTADRAEKALTQYREATERYPGTPAAKFARLGQAAALLDLGKAAEAQRTYAAIAADAEAPLVLRQQGTEGLGFALEAQEKYAEAGERFGKLATLGDGSMSDPARYHQARMLVAQDKPQEAIALLQELLKSAGERQETGEKLRYANEVSDAEVLLAELGEKPDQPVVAPAAAAPGEKPSGAELQKIVESLRKQMEEKGTGSVPVPVPVEPQPVTPAAVVPAKTPGSETEAPAPAAKAAKAAPAAPKTAQPAAPVEPAKPAAPAPQPEAATPEPPAPAAQPGATRPEPAGPTSGESTP